LVNSEAVELVRLSYDKYNAEGIDGSSLSSIHRLSGGTLPTRRSRVCFTVMMAFETGKR
jgi:hypothetical protein